MTENKIGFGVLGPLLMTGSITGAPGIIDPAAIAEQITDRHREIVVCSVSARRAIPAAERLSRLGYDRVHYLAGGYAAWHHRATARYGI
jgi:rhodanese-related sulfurtransferase